MPPKVCPQALSESRLRTAMKRFESIVGASHVFAEALDRQSYADSFAIDDNRHVPLGAVAPMTVEEVRAIVRMAWDLACRCGPISRGKYLGYGGSPRISAARSCSIGLLMKKMGSTSKRRGAARARCRFLRSRRLPAVAQGQVWLSVPGNAGDRSQATPSIRAPRYTSYGEHASKICGVEVVLPDGGLDAPAWTSWCEEPASDRYSIGLGLGSAVLPVNLGIVTRLGVADGRA